MCSSDLFSQLQNHVGEDAVVSVRSGAPVSMPGMMDTVLNVGTPLPGPDASEAHKDQYQRLVTMFGTIVKGHDASVYKGIEHHDAALDAYVAKEGGGLPSVEKQVIACALAIRDSWNNDRAVEYRRINDIREHECPGTAIVIQIGRAHV